MEYDFSADEIFEMAKQIEVNGAAFYRKAAAKVTGEAEQKLLKTIADMEDQHGKTFADMQADLKKEDQENLIFDPQRDVPYPTFGQQAFWHGIIHCHL